MSDEKNLSDKELLYAKVKTTPLRVKVHLVDGASVEGFLHQPASLRLTDTMNRHTRDNPFLAFTDSLVTFPNGEQHRHRFLTLNREMIVCCFPVEEEIDRLV